MIKKMYFQALVALSEVIQQLNEKNPNFIHLKANEPTKIVLLSLGTGGTEGNSGTSKDATEAQKFNLLGWAPILPLYLAGSTGSMNEYHLQTVFSGLPSPDNYYLRIEVHIYMP